MNGTGIKEGARRQHQFVGDVLEVAALHLGPVLVEAGAAGRLIEQGHRPSEPLREALRQGRIVAAQGGRRRLGAIEGPLHLQRRQGLAGAGLSRVAGAIGEQITPQPRVLGAGHPLQHRIPEGIAPVAHHPARLHLEPLQPLPQHRLERIAPEGGHMAHHHAGGGGFSQGGGGHGGGAAATVHCGRPGGKLRWPALPQREWLP